MSSCALSRVACSKLIEKLNLYLRLLGYREDKHVKVLGNLSVFEHPNQPAFVRVMRFLLGVVDGKEAKGKFRNCYPPVDKKGEAEFRKKAFQSYKNLQVENPELIHITPSLLLLPGGPKFINFLITFVRWIALNFIRSNPSKFHEERLSSHFLSSKETTHSLRSIYLKSQINEFKSKGYLIHKNTDDLLKKGKEYIKGLSFKYRVKKSWLDANQVQYNSDYLEELIKRRKDLEEKVNIVSNQMNRQIQQLNLDMSFIKFLQNLSSNVETLDISPCLQKCASFEEYICLVSKELSSGYDPAHITSSWEDTREISDIAENLLKKAKKCSYKITKVLLNLNLKIIPKNVLEVNKLLRTSTKTNYSTEESEKCLLPPTPYVDINVATIYQNPSNFDYGSPLQISTSSKLPKEEQAVDTPCSRYSSRQFSKKNSPIINLKSEFNFFNHLEDLGSSFSDLRCISTFSPVLSSSLMINPIETRKCISPTHPIASTTSNVEHNSSKMEYSDLTLDIIERYKMLKLRSNNLGIPSASISPNLKPSVNIRQQSMGEDNHTPISLENSVSQSNLHNHSGNNNLSNLNSEFSIGSRLEALIETLGGNEDLNLGNEDVNYLLDNLDLPNFEL
uniref:HAUS augminlike complex, subunit 6 [Xenopus laevis] n=1 Tax=Lepeophtheirus salmonis TaxID=72036 RepID=A0A0K2V5L2_LEPSM